MGGVVGLGLTRLIERNEVKEQIAYQESSTSELIPTPHIKTVRVVVVGDVMLGRSVNTRMMKYESVDWPFVQVRETLLTADLALGNLENPLIADCPASDSGMIFCGRSESALGLARAGFDGMSLANNHSFNYGEAGVVETEKTLVEAGVESIGNGLVGEFSVDGIRIGILAYDDVTKPVETARIQEDIRQWRDEVEVLMVMMHWGVEYVAEPNQRQQDLGRWMVDEGVDVVLGSHPHWVQPVEPYKDGLIFYSLGNFVFDQMWSDATRLGEIAEIRFTIQDYNISDIEYELIPVKIYEYGQPKIVGQS